MSILEGNIIIILGNMIIVVHENWAPDADPWEEHMKVNPHCRFLKEVFIFFYKKCVF